MAAPSWDEMQRQSRCFFEFRFLLFGFAKPRCWTSLHLATPQADMVGAILGPDHKLTLVTHVTL